MMKFAEESSSLSPLIELSLSPGVGFSTRNSQQLLGAGRKGSAPRQLGQNCCPSAVTRSAKVTDSTARRHQLQEDKSASDNSSQLNSTSMINGCLFIVVLARLGPCIPAVYHRWKQTSKLISRDNLSASIHKSQSLQAGMMSPIPPSVGIVPGRLFQGGVQEGPGQCVNGAMGQYQAHVTNVLFHICVWEGKALKRCRDMLINNGEVMTTSAHGGKELPVE